MLVQARLGALVIGAICILGAPAISGKSVEDRKWLEVRTENFTVRGDLREKKLVEIAYRLETFRAAVTIVTNVSSTESPIPTEIYALSRKGFKSLGIDRVWVGRFIPGQRSNLMLIRDSPGTGEYSTSLHEYVHFLVRNHSGLNYPRWFDEGFAEYLSAVRIDSEELVLGGIPAERMRNLEAGRGRWIPLRAIISPQAYEDWGVREQGLFYAESWALVHYLHNQAAQQNSMGQRMEQFIQSIESGEDDLTAFESAFGLSLNELDRDVKNYIRRGRYREIRIKLDALAPEFAPGVFKLPREQASLALAKISLRIGEFDKAEHWYTIATMNESTRAHAEAGLGAVLKFQGQLEAAKTHFETAIALAPEDPYCQLDIAKYWHSLAAATEERDKRADYIKKSRTHYVKSWKLDDSIPETYAKYGETYLLEGEQYDRAIDMLKEAEYLLPSDLRIRLALAAAYAGAGRTQDASDLARSVLAWSYDHAELADKVTEFLAALDADKSTQTGTEGTR